MMGQLVMKYLHTQTIGTVPSGDIVQSGFGRLWVAKTSTNNTTVYWSDLLTGVQVGHR
jgi:hypothetical protein